MMASEPVIKWAPFMTVTEKDERDEKVYGEYAPFRRDGVVAELPDGSRLTVKQRKHPDDENRDGWAWYVQAPEPQEFPPVASGWEETEDAAKTAAESAAKDVST